MHYLFLSGDHQVIENLVKKFRSQFNRLFRLGVVHLEYVVDNEFQMLSEFEDAKRWLCIPPNYETKRYTIVARIFAIENKCCTLGGLTITRWHTLVTGHYKYIVSSCNGISILAIS